MPRSRTRARIHAARLAAGLAIHEPDRTAGRVGHLLRVVWKRFARLEDLHARGAGERSGHERRLAILARMDKWIEAIQAEDLAGERGDRGARALRRRGRSTSG